MTLGEFAGVINDNISIRVISELDQNPELQGKILYSGDIVNLFNNNFVVFDDVYLDELYVDYVDVGDYDFTIYVC